MIRTIAPAAVRTDGGTQAREQLDTGAIADYSEAMLDGAAFPPIVVFWDGKWYWLADGFHRVAAALRARLGQISADVRQGTQREAMLWACGANTDHGVRRTNADKRTVVERLLLDQEWAKWSDREIAGHCRVSREYVCRMRAACDRPQAARSATGASCDRSQDALPGETRPDDSPSATRTVNRGGKTYTMDTGSIGKKAAAPEPDAVVNGQAPTPRPPRDQVGIPLEDERTLAAFAEVPAFTELIRLAKELQTKFIRLAGSPGGHLLRKEVQARSRSGKPDEMYYRHEGLHALKQLLEDTQPWSSLCPYCFFKGQANQRACPGCEGQPFVGHYRFSSKSCPPEMRQAVLDHAKTFHQDAEA